MRGIPHWLIWDTKEMLDCFGFPWFQVCEADVFGFQFSHCVLQAPGEAEAKLACMLRRGEIDAILTDDSDVVVFGATMLL